jgi:hypothetical protein
MTCRDQPLFGCGRRLRCDPCIANFRNIGLRGRGLGEQQRPQIPVAEPAESELAAADRSERCDLARCMRVQRPNPTALVPGRQESPRQSGPGRGWRGTGVLRGQLRAAYRPDCGSGVRAGTRSRRRLIVGNGWKTAVDPCRILATTPPAQGAVGREGRALAPNPDAGHRFGFVTTPTLQMNIARRSVCGRLTGILCYN